MCETKYATVPKHGNVANCPSLQYRILAGSVAPTIYLDNKSTMQLCSGSRVNFYRRYAASSHVNEGISTHARTCCRIGRVSKAGLLGRRTIYVCISCTRFSCDGGNDIWCFVGRAERVDTEFCFSRRLVMAIRSVPGG